MPCEMNWCMSCRSTLPYNRQRNIASFEDHEKPCAFHWPRDDNPLKLPADWFVDETRDRVSQCLRLAVEKVVFALSQL